MSSSLAARLATLGPPSPPSLTTDWVSGELKGGSGETMLGAALPLAMLLGVRSVQTVSVSSLRSLKRSAGAVKVLEGR